MHSTPLNTLYHVWYSSQPIIPHPESLRHNTAWHWNDTSGLKKWEQRLCAPSLTGFALNPESKAHQREIKIGGGLCDCAEAELYLDVSRADSDLRKINEGVPLWEETELHLTGRGASRSRVERGAHGDFLPNLRSVFQFKHNTSDLCYYLWKDLIYEQWTCKIWAMKCEKRRWGWKLFIF